MREILHCDCGRTKFNCMARDYQSPEVKQISTASCDLSFSSHHYTTRQIRDCGRHAFDDCHSLPGIKDAAHTTQQLTDPSSPGAEKWSRHQCLDWRVRPRPVVKWRASGKVFDVSCKPRASIRELELELAGVGRRTCEREILL